MIGHIGLVQTAEARLVLGPGELPRIDQYATDTVAVTTQILGQGMHHDVCAMLERAAEVGRGHRVVDDQRYAVSVGNGGNGTEVGDVAERVADGFAEHRLGARVDQVLERCRVAVIGKADLDAELWQRVGEEIVGATVQSARADDIVALLGNGHQCVGDGGTARGQCERTDAALKFGDALLEHVAGRVHDARVDVALHLEIKQIRSVLRAVEGVGGGLVDRYGDGLGGGIWRVAAVHGDGFRAHV